MPTLLFVFSTRLMDSLFCFVAEGLTGVAFTAVAAPVVVVVKSRVIACSRETAKIRKDVRGPHTSAHLMENTT